VVFLALNLGQPGSPNPHSRTHLEWWATEGDSPVGEMRAEGGSGQSTIP
jgi:hypothetical protein